MPERNNLNFDKNIFKEIGKEDFKDSGVYLPDDVQALPTFNEIRENVNELLRKFRTAIAYNLLIPSQLGFKILEGSYFENVEYFSRYYDMSKFYKGDGSVQPYVYTGDGGSAIDDKVVNIEEQFLPIPAEFIKEDGNNNKYVDIPSIFGYIYKPIIESFKNEINEDVFNFYIYPKLRYDEEKNTFLTYSPRPGGNYFDFLLWNMPLYIKNTRYLSIIVNFLVEKTYGGWNEGYYYRNGFSYFFMNKLMRLVAGFKVIYENNEYYKNVKLYKFNSEDINVGGKTFFQKILIIELDLYKLYAFDNIYSFYGDENYRFGNEIKLQKLVYDSEYLLLELNFSRPYKESENRFQGLWLLELIPFAGRFIFFNHLNRNDGVININEEDFSNMILLKTGEILGGRDIYDISLIPLDSFNFYSYWEGLLYGNNEYEGSMKSFTIPDGDEKLNKKFIQVNFNSRREINPQTGTK